MNKPLYNFKELIVWQKSVDLAVKIYQITSLFPSEERFVLSSQMNRSGISISSNIAEGYQRSTSKDYLNFPKIAKGSLAELETQIIIANKLNLISKERYNEVVSDVVEIEKILGSIIFKIKNKLKNSST